MSKIVFCFLGVYIYTLACCAARDIPRESITQGIEGYIYYISGNQMPSPDRKLPPPKGIKTTLYIYRLTNINQVTRQGQSVFYSFVNTKFVAKTSSDSSGYFKVRLDPSRYSLFTKKGALFYASTFDKDNNIAPVEVLPGQITKVSVKIDYDATY